MNYAKYPLALSAQRRAHFASASYTSSIPTPAPAPLAPRPFQLKQTSHPNIDPSLRNAGVSLPGASECTAVSVENLIGSVHMAWI